MFHREGSHYYDKTKQGKYMTETEAIKEGDRPAAGGRQRCIGSSVCLRLSSRSLQPSGLRNYSVTKTFASGAFHTLEWS